MLTEEANCVKSDVERSGIHAVVDRADTFLENLNGHSKETVFRWTASSCEMAFKASVHPVTVDLGQSAHIYPCSHICIGK